MLDHLEALFQLVVLFHEIDDSLICVLELTLSHSRYTSTVDGARGTTCRRHILEVANATARDTLVTKTATTSFSVLRQVSRNETGSDAALDRSAMLIDGHVAQSISSRTHAIAHRGV